MLMVSKSDQSSMNQVITPNIAIMLKDHIPNAMIYTMTNTKPLLQQVRSQQLKFLGHILHLPDGELAKTCPLCANAWKMMSWPSAFLLPVIQATCKTY